MKIAGCRTTALMLLLVSSCALVSRAEEPVKRAKAENKQAPAVAPAADAAAPAAKPAPAANKAAAAPAVRRLVIRNAGNKDLVVNGLMQRANNQNALVDQWKRQFRPILLAELNAVRQYCKPTVEQRPAILAAGEKGLQEAAVQYAKIQQGGNAANAAAKYGFSPSTVIRDDLMKQLPAILSPEQFAEYSKQTEARVAQRKRAAILCFVSRLDDALCLSDEQRAQILQSVSSKWRDHWEHWLMISRYGEQYFPHVADDLLEPHLDAGQKSIWQGLSKIGGVQFLSPIVQPQDDTEWWQAEQAKPVEPPDAAVDPRVGPNGLLEVIAE